MTYDLFTGPNFEKEGQVKIPEDLFDVVVNHDDLKQLFMASLRAVRPVHILLVGPPATAKSVFLMELKRLPRSRYALGGTSSKAGIVDFVIQERPRYLLVDELDKMDMKDYAALLSLMETGEVVRLKRGMTDEIRVKIWVFAAVNRDDTLPHELRSRFQQCYLTEYSEQDFKKVVRTMLVKREDASEDVAANIADKVAEYSRDVRDAIRIARLYYSEGQHMSIDELVKLARRYQRKREHRLLY
jgi:Holliday junction DNA helicase RuvB